MICQVKINTPNPFKVHLNLNSSNIKLQMPDGNLSAFLRRLAGSFLLHCSNFSENLILFPFSNSRCMNRNLSGVKLFKTDAQLCRALFKLLFNQGMLRLKKTTYRCWRVRLHHELNSRPFLSIRYNVEREFWTLRDRVAFQPVSDKLKFTQTFYNE